MTQTAPEAGSTPALHHLTGRIRRRSYIAALSGNFLEWFDWTMFAVFTPYIALNFFDQSDPVSALLNTLIVFAVGFVTRPLGAFVLGRTADRLGRRLVLLICVGVMSACALAIAVIPAYATIGVAASALLVVVRLLQGFVHGGEAGAAYTYIAELAPRERRGLWASGAFVSANTGALLATGLALILTSVLGPEAMNAYGWRVAFVAAGVLGVVVYFLRRAAAETLHEELMEHTRATRQRTPDAPRTWTRRALVIRIVLIGVLCASSTMPYYIWGSLASTTAITNHGMDPQAAFAVSLTAQILILALLPAAGWFADRFGRRTSTIVYGIGVAIAPLPLSLVLSDQPWTLFVYMFIGLTLWTFMGAMLPAYTPELLPTAVRTFGVSFGSAVAIAIFSGTAPYIQQALVNVGIGWVFGIYMSLTGLLALVAAKFLPETKGIDLNEVTLGDVPAVK